MDKNKMTQVVLGCQRGDPHAQELLIEDIQNRVYYYCLKMIKNEQDAMDASQDILITVLEKIGALKQPEAFWGWLNRIIANRCKNMFTRGPREMQIPEDEEGNSMLDMFEETDQQLVPEQAIDNDETCRMIVELVNALPPQQRLCVLMYYYDEMSVKDIAGALEVPENTVKSRLNYARKSIKEGVLKYERQGVKLYGLSPVSFLLQFLQKDAGKCTPVGAGFVPSALTRAAHAATTEVHTAAEISQGAPAVSTTTSVTDAGHAVTQQAIRTGITGAAKVVSLKLVAAVVAGAVALAGVAAVGAQVIRRRQETTEETTSSVYSSQRGETVSEIISVSQEPIRSVPEPEESIIEEPKPQGEILENFQIPEGAFWNETQGLIAYTMNLRDGFTFTLCNSSQNVIKILTNSDALDIPRSFEGKLYGFNSLLHFPIELTLEPGETVTRGIDNILWQLPVDENGNVNESLVPPYYFQLLYIENIYQCDQEGNLIEEGGHSLVLVDLEVDGWNQHLWSGEDTPAGSNDTSGSEFQHTGNVFSGECQGLTAYTTNRTDGFVLSFYNDSPNTIKILSLPDQFGDPCCIYGEIANWGIQQRIEEEFEIPSKQSVIKVGGTLPFSEGNNFYQFLVVENIYQFDSDGKRIEEGAHSINLIDIIDQLYDLY